MITAKMLAILMGFNSWNLFTKNINLDCYLYRKLL